VSIRGLKRLSRGNSGKFDGLERWTHSAQGSKNRLSPSVHEETRMDSKENALQVCETHKSLIQTPDVHQKNGPDITEERLPLTGISMCSLYYTGHSGEVPSLHVTAGPTLCAASYRSRFSTVEIVEALPHADAYFAACLASSRVTSLCIALYMFCELAAWKSRSRGKPRISLCSLVGMDSPYSERREDDGCHKCHVGQGYLPRAHGGSPTSTRLFRPLNCVFEILFVLVPIPEGVLAIPEGCDLVRPLPIEHLALLSGTLASLYIPLRAPASRISGDRAIPRRVPI
jgi:hypothetical protein